MSQTGRSYYEIALTNRQVLLAFSILLMCVVAAFVSGLWVGRQAAARSFAGEGERAELQAPSDTYRFFSQEGGEGAAGAPPADGAAAAARPAAPPSKPPTPTRQVTPMARSEPPPPPPPPPSRAEPPATRENEPARQAASPPVSEPEPEPESEPAESTETPAELPKVVDPPSTSELSVIQVFSTPEEGQARAVLERLVGGGFRAFLSPVQVDGRTMYRVRVGPFTERSVAEREAEKLKRLYKLDTWITN